MLGETRKPILPHPRSAQYGRARQKQFPISSGQAKANRNRIACAGLVAAGGLGVLVMVYSPDLRTFAWAGGGVLCMVLLLGLRRLCSGSHLVRMRVRPEFALMLVTIWGCVLSAEIGLRAFFPHRFRDVENMPQVGGYLGYRFDAQLGWFPVPNSRRTFNAGREVMVSHNSRGFRDPEPTLDARPAMVFLGDSFVWGYGVEAAERFTEHLRAREPGWRIHNLGVTGYSTDQEYLLLQKHFENYQPRLVFLVYCENDEAGNGTNNYLGWYGKPYYTVGKDGLKLEGSPVPWLESVFCAEHALLAHSFLLRLAVRAYGRLRSPPPPPGSSPTTALLDAMNRYSAARGAAFCVGFVQRDPRLENFLDQASIPYVDLTTDLLQQDGHWNPEGHAYVSGKIREFLLQRQLPQQK